MKAISTFTLLLFCLANCSLNSQTTNEKIDEVIQKYVEFDRFSGTVLLAKDGKILYAKAFGDANKSYKVKNNLETKFNIASMGKMFTGVSIFQLEEDGKLNLTDPVVKHLKGFPHGNKITIYHLLSHTSGIGSYMRHPDYRANRNRFKQISEIVPFIYEQKLEFDTSGEQFSYSNSGMVLLGAIIEKISGQSYSEYITKNILVPTKMANTAMKFGDEIVLNRSTGYMKTVTGTFTNNNFYSSSPFSDGGILSTVGDMLKFDQALYGSSLISEKSKKKLFTKATPKETYGLAFQVEERQGNKVVGHSGGMPGYSSYFSRYLNDRYTIIALSNYDMISKHIVHYIENILYKNDYKLPKQLLGQFIYKNMKKIDSLKSIKEMSEFIKKNYTVRYSGYLNRISYSFLHEGFKGFAIKLFKLNVYLFPDDGNVYDSLGEAYEGVKEYKLALLNYEKAVKVATKNSSRSLNSFIATLERFKKKFNNL